MKCVILGGGLSAISSAFYAQMRNDIDEILILEKDDEIGGLCRSIKKNGYTYDIGPHILFSKNQDVLNLMLDLLPEKNRLKRSNQIIHKDCWVQYPFENDLSSLSDYDLNYCIQSFYHNPYENYIPTNMLQFFLKTFGEGITDLYLRPYNEKIWKFDPCYMDTQMVERIPKPTRDEIERSASGEKVDGYLHQLYFYYPCEGGIEAVVRGMASELTDKCSIRCNQNVEKIEKKDDGFDIWVNGEIIHSDRLMSTIPLQEIAKVYSLPQDVRTIIDDLKYNSILVAFVKVKKDMCGSNFTFTIADKDIIFHRISKMDFLGDVYRSDGATYMVEVTYRKGDHIDSMDENDIKKKIKEGIVNIKFAEKLSDIELVDVIRREYAYVIYDLKHKSNMEKIRKFFSDNDIMLNGRFGNFEYWNMDRIIEESEKRVKAW